MALSRKSPFMLTATVDFPDDVRDGPYTHALLDELMSLLRGLGVRRINWLYYGDDDPESYWAGYIFPAMAYGPETLGNIGEPLRAGAAAAHRHGLEIYGVLKPYNAGAPITKPQGLAGSPPGAIRRIGGPLVSVIPFIQRNPHARVRRRPASGPEGLDGIPIRRIKLRKSDDLPTRIARENIQIWVSPDNYRYTRYEGGFTLTESVEPAPRDVADYYGTPVVSKGSPVRTLTLGGLDLPDAFVLVTTDLKDGEPDFRNTAVGMIEAYGPGPDPLPITVATRSDIWDHNRDFRTHGLEFDSGWGMLQLYLDADNSTGKGERFWSSLPSHGVVAFARGKNEYLAATPAESLPDVRRLWSGWVDRILDSGVDGLDIRVSAHGSLTDEPLEYGYDEPVVEEYRRIHGCDPDGSEEARAGIAAIRGRHFTDFIREASGRARSAGRRFQAHMHTEAFRPEPCHGQLMGFPANVRYEWREWLDEGLINDVVFRTSWFEALEDHPDSPAQRSRLDNALSEGFAAEVLVEANGRGLPVYINRYIDRAVGTADYVADLERIAHDERFAGFDLYETASFISPTPDGSRLVGTSDALERLTEASKRLGLYRG